MYNERLYAKVKRAHRIETNNMKPVYSGLFLILSISYLFSLGVDIGLFSAPLKIAPIAVLIIAVAKEPAFSGNSFLIVALAFSAVGDLFLQQGFFIFGVAAFLVAQLSYAVFFVRCWHSVSARWPASVLILIYVLIMAFLLTPHLGNLKLPVFGYLIVIGFMGLLATQSNMPWRWSVLGALVFIASDSLIAIDRFLRPIPMSGFLIMTTYYCAQWMIIQGCLKNPNRSNLGR